MTVVHGGGLVQLSTGRYSTTMTPHEPILRDGVPRRVVLIDLDWRDADLVPDLLRHPGLDVSLVAGPSADDPGVRVAELCGVPHTLELGELGRERFDLALLGARSARRAQVVSLLEAFATPVMSPDTFMEGIHGAEWSNETGYPSPLDELPEPILELRGGGVRQLGGATVLAAEQLIGTLRRQQFTEKLQ